MYKKAVRYVLAVAGAFALPAEAASPDRKPLPEAEGSSIGYDTVEEAIRGLRSNAGVTFKVENGWTIATDESSRTIWSFAPPGYPAYPAVVKRQVVPRGSGSQLQMSVHCEASKQACDDLIRTFSEMNGF